VLFDTELSEAFSCEEVEKFIEIGSLSMIENCFSFSSVHAVFVITTNQIALCQEKNIYDFSKENLNELKEKIIAKQKEYNVPGIAIAIVKEGQVVYTETFGYADSEKKVPVTENTIFPIGSSSKPMTATMIAMLVSEGKMKWDDPVEKHLPYFKLKLKPSNINIKTTIGDLLSHRTGIITGPLILKAVNFLQDPNWDPKDDALKFSREELIKEMMKIEAGDTFRLKHNYNNIGITAAAESSAKAMNMTWDKLMKEKMFKPLSMLNTTTSISQIKDMDNFAKGYLQGKEGNTTALLTNMDVISPAGGINSTINDMAKWLQFILDKNRKIQISDKELDMMWTKQVNDASFGGKMPGYSYGMGWFIKEWNNYKIAEHMGNALGYSANLSVIPELGIGYVVLSNLMPSALQHEIDIENMIWETLIQTK